MKRCCKTANENVRLRKVCCWKTVAIKPCLAHLKPKYAVKPSQALISLNANTEAACGVSLCPLEAIKRPQQCHYREEQLRSSLAGIQRRRKLPGKWKTRSSATAEIAHIGGHYAVRGLSWSPISVPIGSPHATSCYLLLTCILSRTVSKSLRSVGHIFAFDSLTHYSSG